MLEWLKYFLNDFKPTLCCNGFKIALQIFVFDLPSPTAEWGCVKDKIALICPLQTNGETQRCSWAKFCDLPSFGKAEIHSALKGQMHHLGWRSVNDREHVSWMYGNLVSQIPNWSKSSTLSEQYSVWEATASFRFFLKSINSSLTASSWRGLRLFSSDLGSLLNVDYGIADSRSLQTVT